MRNGNVVFNGHRVRHAMMQASTRRIDFISHGDSTQLGGGIGHDHGHIYGLLNLFKAYGTGVWPFVATSSSGHNTRDMDMSGGPGQESDWETVNNPPAGMLALEMVGEDVSGLPSKNRAFLEDADTKSHAFTSNPIVIFPANRYGNQGVYDRMQWHFTYGEFAAGTSTGFQPVCRKGSTGGFYATGSTIDTVQGADTTTDYNLEVDQDHTEVQRATDRMAFSPVKFNSGNDMTGPFWAAHQRVIWPDTTAGFAYSTLFHQGSQGMRHCATALKDAGWEATTNSDEYMRQLTRHQAGNKIAIAILTFAGNDASDSVDSVGPSPTASNTGAGYADNVQACITSMDATWTSAGLDTDNLFYIVNYHPRSDVFALELEFEDAVIDGICPDNDRVCVVRGTSMVSTQEMLGGWYSAGPDIAHLTQFGHEHYGQNLFLNIMKSKKF